MCHRGDFGPEWGREREELAEEVDADEADEEAELPSFATDDAEKDLEVLTDGGDGD